MQRMMLPIEQKSIQPVAMVLEGDNIQAMQQFIGQGRWQGIAISHSLKSLSPSARRVARPDLPAPQTSA